MRKMDLARLGRGSDRLEVLRVHRLVGRMRVDPAVAQRALEDVVERPPVARQSAPPELAGRDRRHRPSAAKSRNGRESAIVFGGRGKLRAEGPYLSLLAELEMVMTRVERLVIVGYSFRDDHVNEVIRRWTTERDSNRIVVIDPRFPEHPSPAGNDFRDELMRASCRLGPSRTPSRRTSK
jgi:hypothetical protein